MEGKSSKGLKFILIGVSVLVVNKQLFWKMYKQLRVLISSSQSAAYALKYKGEGHGPADHRGGGTLIC